MRALRWSVMGVVSLAACRYNVGELPGPGPGIDAPSTLPDAEAPDLAPDLGTDDSPGSGDAGVDRPDAPVGGDGPRDGMDGGAVVMDVRPQPDWGPIPPLPVNTVAREYLMAYWKLDEGMGEDTLDSTGNGNNGVLLHDPDPTMMATGPDWRPPGFPEGKFPNNATIFFDGKDDYVEFLPNKLPDIELPKSISVWFRYDFAVQPTDIASIFVLLDRQGALGGGVRLEIRQSRLRIANYQTFDGSPEVVGVPAPPQGWHHVVYTYDGTTHALYIDGAAPVTSTFAFTDKGKPNRCRIGKSSSGVVDPFRGFIDDVRVYSRALTPMEVASLKAGAP